VRVEPLGYPSTLGNRVVHQILVDAIIIQLCEENGCVLEGSSESGGQEWRRRRRVVEKVNPSRRP
jgi:hypothetical protein